MSNDGLGFDSGHVRSVPKVASRRAALHRQLTEEQRALAGAGDDVIRLSIGLETADDLIRDLDQALVA